jgi:glycerophosphoryl diester phosphodiesterase
MLDRRPLVVAHRGASSTAIDNSLEAFAQAIEDGADMIEFDVRITGDQHLVAFHDAAVAGRRLDTLRHVELEQLAGHRPPLLQEVLELAAGRIALDVELKEESTVERVIDAVRRRYGSDEVVVTSFLPSAVRRARTAWPEVMVGLTLDDSEASDLRDAVAQAHACGATAVSVAYPIVQRDDLACATEVGLPVFVWTVDDLATLRMLLADAQLTGVITNVPAQAVAIRAQQQAST